MTDRIKLWKGGRKQVKPALRGVVHQWAFPAAAVAGVALVLLAPAGEPRLAAAVYACSLAAVLGTSALYHRVDWSRAGVRSWMRRLDHSMIFLLIAGTVTPFALLVMDGSGLVGVISERDYARKVILKGRSSLDTRVEDIMLTRVICARPEQSVEECMGLMTAKAVRHLPVLDHKEVVGIMSIGDLVKAIIGELPQEPMASAASPVQAANALGITVNDLSEEMLDHIIWQVHFGLHIHIFEMFFDHRRAITQLQ